MQSTVSLSFAGRRLYPQNPRLDTTVNEPESKFTTFMNILSLPLQGTTCLRIWVLSLLPLAKAIRRCVVPSHAPFPFDAVNPSCNTQIFYNGGAVFGLFCVVYRAVQMCPTLLLLSLRLPCICVKGLQFLLPSHVVAIYPFALSCFCTPFNFVLTSTCCMTTSTCMRLAETFWVISWVPFVVPFLRHQELFASPAHFWF